MGCGRASSTGTHQLIICEDNMQPLTAPRHTKDQDSLLLPGPPFLAVLPASCHLRAALPLGVVLCGPRLRRREGSASSWEGCWEGGGGRLMLPSSARVHCT